MTRPCPGSSTHGHQARAQCAWCGCGVACGRWSAAKYVSSSIGPSAGAERNGSRYLAPVAADPAEASGGRADVGGAEQSVRTIATVESADQLARMDIVLSDGRRVRLDQVASITDTVAEQRSARAAQWQAGGRLRDRAQPRLRARNRSGRRCARRTGQAQSHPPRHHHHRGLQFLSIRCRKTSTARWRC